MSKKRKPHSNKSTPDHTLRETGHNTGPGRDSDIKILVLLLLLAFVLRIIFLGRAELWQDEMLLVMTADIRYKAVEVLRNYWNSHMVAMAWLPLPAFIQNIFMSSISSWVPGVMQNPFAARLPGVLLGVTGVAGVYFLSRAFYERFVSLSATLIAAATFYPIFYAREVHAYPMLLALAPWTLHFYTRALFEDQPRPRVYVTLFVLASLLAYTHLTATMVLFAMGVISTFFLTKQFLSKTRSSMKSYRFGATTIAIGLAGTTVIPVFLKILGGENPHLRQPGNTSPLLILNDVVSKLFLGDRPVMSCFAWLVMFAGAQYVLVRRKDGTAPVMHLAVFLLGGLLIMLAAIRTQYSSARYFIVVTPLIMILTAAGFAAIADFTAKTILRRRNLAPVLRSALIGAFIAAHLLVFLPPMYLLKNKSVDYGSIAQWLNANLPKRTPFLMESAYELRFVGGYHPTPGLVPASPYVHGHKPEEMDYLHEKQIDFMRRFPEAPFIESAHHGYNTEKGLWNWPHQNFRRHVRLSNDSLRTLITSGIFPDSPLDKITDVSYRTDIYFNTWEDRVEAARTEGHPVLFTYEGWQLSGQRVSPRETIYFRLLPGLRGSIKLHNISGSPVSGNADLRYVLPGNPGTETSVNFFINGEIAAKAEASAGQVFEISIPVNNLPPGANNLIFIMPGISAVKGFILLEAKWSTTSGNGTGYLSKGDG